MEPHRSCEWHRKSAKFFQMLWLEHYQVGAGLLRISSETSKDHNPVLLCRAAWSGDKLGLSGSASWILPGRCHALLLHIKLQNRANKVASGKTKAISIPERRKIN